MTAHLFPLERAEIGGKEIRLGMTRAEVAAVLGKGETHGKNRTYFFGSEVAVDFDDDGKVKFIEFLGGIDGEVQPELYGVPVFSSDAHSFRVAVEKQTKIVAEEKENGHSLIFPALSLGLYRTQTAESVRQMIAEEEADGNAMREEEIAEEMRRTHWATVGIGVRGYYDGIAE